MIKSITVINNANEQLMIELGAPEKTGLWVKSIKGIGPGKASINTTDMASSDGGIFNSARAEIRNITLTIGIVAAQGLNVEQIRHNTYRWFAKKKSLTFIITTDVITLATYGYVESNEPDIFNKQETMAISIICPDPNFYAVSGSEGVDFSAIEDAFEFPLAFIQTQDTSFLPDKIYYEYLYEEYVFTTDPEMVAGKTYYEEDPAYGYENDVTSTEYFQTQDTEMKSGKEYFEKSGDEYYSTADINGFIDGKTYYEYNSITEFATLATIANKSFDYDGEISVGVDITIYISGEVTGLSIHKVYDSYNFDTLSINDEAISMIVGSGLIPGDEIRICTTKGSKYAVLIRNAEQYNIINALGKSPSWFELNQGLNTFSYSAVSGANYVSIDISYTKAYEGV